MKITHNKVISILSTISLSLFFQQTFCNSWMQDYFHKLEGAHYKKNCSLIDFGQKIRYAAQILYYRTIHSKTTLDEALAEIETELKNFETVLFDLEQKTLENIKEKYAIQNELWQKCLSDIEQVKISYKKGMLNNHPSVIHDSTVPTDIKDILTTLLKQNDINPSSVSIVMANKEMADSQPGILANTGFFRITYISDKKLIIDTNYIPATITIFPGLVQESLEEKISICAHEIQHLVLQHSITNLVLLKYLAHCCSIDEQTIRQTPEFYQLNQIHEAQAEVVAAIKNHHVSHCLAWFRKQHYYPKYLYEEHFYALSTINMLWKVHDKLEALYFAT